MSLKNATVLVALAGESGAGKSTSAAILAARGFAMVDCTKNLRRVAEMEHGNPTRAEIQEFARQTQERRGNDYFARFAIETLDPDFRGDVVVDGLRNADELAYASGFAAKTGRRFGLVGLVVPAEIRFQRVCDRGRDGDPTSFSTLREDDRRARGNGQSGFQINSYLVEACDFRIENTGDVAKLDRALSVAVEKIRRNHESAES